MRTIILKYNLNALTKPSKEYLQSFELRQDVSKLRTNIKKAKEGKKGQQAWRSNYFRLQRLLRTLLKQAVV